MSGFPVVGCAVVSENARAHRRRRTGHRRAHQAHARAWRRRSRPRSVGSAVTRRSRPSPRSPPDLIILDLNLPVLSGLEVCRILRARADDRAGADHHADGADDARPIASRAWTSAPTITSPSRSACASWPRASGRCSRRGRRRARGAAPSIAASSSVADFEAVAVSVEASRFASRGANSSCCGIWSRTGIACCRAIACSSACGATTALIETRSVDVHVGRLRASSASPGRQIETVVGLGYRFVD